jgi:uncharacterized membrane protein
MSTMLIAVKRSSWFRAKYLLFAAIGLMLAYVILHDESFLVHPKDPIWQHYAPFKWWLLPHGIAGACALLLGPMQFSDRLRDRFRQLHRVAGRIYVTGVFVAAPLGFYIQYFQERTGDPRSFSVAAAVDAALWITTTGIAIVFILKGKVQEHRQWMTRSFAVALVFLEGRTLCFSGRNWGAHPQCFDNTRQLRFSGRSKLQSSSSRLQSRRRVSRGQGSSE